MDKPSVVSAETWKVLAGEHYEGDFSRTEAIIEQLTAERDEAERRYGELLEAVRTWNRAGSLHYLERMLRLAGIPTKPFKPPHVEGDNPVA